MGVFEGAAYYYDKYRPGVPDELVNSIMEDMDCAPDTLLDLGTATGNVLEQFAPRFKRIISVEPDVKMLEYAKKRLADYNTVFLNEKAETLSLPGVEVSLATIGRALHWMDQDKVIRRLDKVVEPLGLVAVFGDRSIWRAKQPWKQTAKRVVQQFLGQERRAGEARFTDPEKRYEEVFRAHTFSDVKSYIFPVERHLDIEQFIGLLYSTSFANKELLKGRTKDFESSMEESLRPFTEKGRLIDRNEFELVLAKRPK
jgi:ubiquinone/menaquinone biosynthesis C-methylase UbiE